MGWCIGISFKWFKLCTFSFYCDPYFFLKHMFLENNSKLTIKTIATRGINKCHGNDKIKYHNHDDYLLLYKYIGRAARCRFRQIFRSPKIIIWSFVQSKCSKVEINGKFYKKYGAILHFALYKHTIGGLYYNPPDSTDDYQHMWTLIYSHWFTYVKKLCMYMRCWVN